MKKIKRAKILDLLVENKSNIFSVVFLKKDGSIRRMLCRFGVKKHLKGGKLKFNPLERNLLVVFDMQKEAYRFINLDTLEKIRIKGREYEIK